MKSRRILSLWFPRLGAERFLRQNRGLPPRAFAVVGEAHNAQVLVSLSAEAEAAGLTRGQALRDAMAMCPTLETRLRNRDLDAGFLMLLRRWAGKFSPWVSEEPPESLVIDITGCTHLFGGEEGLIDLVETDCATLGLTVQVGVADTVGAAWALARFAGQGIRAGRSGDDIDQEAHATRSRAARRRHWERGGPPPAATAPGSYAGRIAPKGQMRTVLAGMPVAALRLDEDTRQTLARLGLHQIGDLAGQPRGALARRFGKQLVRRLDQAFGIEAEPVSPVRPPVHFSVRLTLPDPIGLSDDIAAALDRLLPALSEKLTAKGRGVRRLRMECHRADHTMQRIEVGLARPSAAPDRIRPLLMMKVDEIDAGFGIDMIRLEALVSEPVHAHQHRGHAEAAAVGAARRNGGAALDDLIGRIGARAEAAKDWPRAPAPRPVEIWPPDIVTAPDTPHIPAQFRWRGRQFETRAALGPERISPEWWLDDPNWRSGVRDYWRITTSSGDRLWLYYGHGASLSAGWFCQGAFS